MLTNNKGYRDGFKKGYADGVASARKKSGNANIPCNNCNKTGYVGK